MVRVSHEDVAFLRSLRESIDAGQHALDAGQPADPNGDGQAATGADGSFVIGRVDTVEGKTFYVGTRGVAGPGDVLVIAQDSDAGEQLWQATSSDAPGRVILKRHLSVRDWSVAGSHDEFDLRGATRRGGSGGGLDDPRQRLDDVRQAHAAASAVLETALEQVRRGAVVKEDLQRRVLAWNDALSKAGRTYGLTDGQLTLGRLEEEVTADVDRRRQRAARREELDRKISALDSMIDDGSLARDQLLKLRQDLLRQRDADEGSAGPAAR